MAIQLTIQEIHKRFGPETLCRVSYKGTGKTKNADGGQKLVELKHVNLKKVTALTLLFEKPKQHLIDGEACKRDGIRVVVV